MKITPILIGLFISVNLIAQSDRAEIISKKIKSITTKYWTSDSSAKIDEKKYYTVRGDDSLEYYCGKLSFKFKTILAKNGKVERLERSDAVDRVDEWHIYTYEKDDSYSIEVVAHGAGTILFSKYDNLNNCLEQIFSGVETIHYEYDSDHKLKRLLYNEHDEKPIELAKVLYNKEGLIKRIIGTKEAGQVQLYTYNGFGLVSEKTNIQKDENGDEVMRSVFYEYEFRQ